jgi:hypothetical protein
VKSYRKEGSNWKPKRHICSTNRNYRNTSSSSRLKRSKPSKDFLMKSSRSRRVSQSKTWSVRRILKVIKITVIVSQLKMMGYMIHQGRVTIQASTKTLKTMDNTWMTKTSKKNTMQTMPTFKSYLSRSLNLTTSLALSSTVSMRTLATT